MGSSGSKPEPVNTAKHVEARLAGNVSAPKTGKSGKKICCSCPETKAARDDCVIMNGEDECKKFIEAHKECLRLEGFDIR
eukprot:g6069.t1